MEFKSLIDYYQNLLILQYKKLPKATGHLEAFLRQVVIFDLLETVSNGFDLETATDDRLTKLGFFVGINREIRQILLEKYFGSISYTNSTEQEGVKSNLIGSRQYTSTAIPGKLWNYRSLVQYVYNWLSDSQLRKFIKMKLEINRGNSSLKSIDDFFQIFFGAQVSVTTDPKNDLLLVYGVEKVPLLVVPPPTTDTTDTDLDPEEDNRLDDFFRYTLEKRVYPKPAGFGFGGRFVLLPLLVFSSLNYSIDEESDFEEFLESGRGALTYKSSPLGVTALYNHREETYAQIK